jgi:hypothetical protein
MKTENERADRERIERERNRQFELEKLRSLDKTEVLPVKSEFDAGKNISSEISRKAVDKYFP